MKCTAKTAISCVSDTPGYGSWQEAFILGGNHFSGAEINLGLERPILYLSHFCPVKLRKLGFINVNVRSLIMHER